MAEGDHMRLVWEEINEDLVGEKTNVLRDEIEMYADQKPTVISEGGVVSANRRMATSVFGGRLLDQDGATYMAKTCQVQLAKDNGKPDKVGRMRSQEDWG